MQTALQKLKDEKPEAFLIPEQWTAETLDALKTETRFNYLKNMNSDTSDLVADAKLKAEAKAKLKAKTEDKLKTEAEAKLKADAEARLKADADDKVEATTETTTEATLDTESKQANSEETIEEKK
jgi:membrane protein involved in colicin uptake